MSRWVLIGAVAAGYVLAALACAPSAGAGSTYSNADSLTVPADWAVRSLSGTSACATGPRDGNDVVSSAGTTPYVYTFVVPAGYTGEFTAAADFDSMTAGAAGVLTFDGASQPATFDGSGAVQRWCNEFFTTAVGAGTHTLSITRTAGTIALDYFVVSTTAVATTTTGAATTTTAPADTTTSAAATTTTAGTATTTSAAPTTSTIPATTTTGPPAGVLLSGEQAGVFWLLAAGMSAALGVGFFRLLWGRNR